METRDMAGGAAGRVDLLGLMLQAKAIVGEDGHALRLVLMRVARRRAGDDEARARLGELLAPRAV